MGERADQGGRFYRDPHRPRRDPKGDDMTEPTQEMLDEGVRAYNQHGGQLRVCLKAVYVAMRAREVGTSAVPRDVVEAALNVFWGDIGWRTADDDESIKWNCMSHALAAAD